MHRIVLTGGPKGGKSEACAFLKEEIVKWGWGVTCVPEIPTLFINGGVDFKNLTAEQFMGVEELIFDAQTYFEEHAFRRVAEIQNKKNQVMFTDRGLPDLLAYMTPEMFQRILDKRGLSMMDVRDLRYDGAVHLLTVADGKPELFDNANNPARYEKSAAQAVATDRRTQNAWLGHPHLRVIDNSTDFPGKLRRLLAVVRRMLDLPAALEIERKFLVQCLPAIIPIPHQVILVEQAYINTPEYGKLRIRRRSQDNGGMAYFETRKQATKDPRVRLEVERHISAMEYYGKLRYARPNCDIIRKSRHYFIWNHQYFELDVFTEPERLRGLVLLEIELTERNDRIVIPDWLTAAGKVEEVTDDPKFSNSALAHRP